MTTRHARIALVALAALLLVSGAALAQTAGYSLARHVIAGGGGRSTGGEYILQGTIGQAATGWSQSGSYRLSGGFWVPEEGGEPPQPDQQQLYLPLVLRGS